MCLFENKYGDKVRVIKFGDFSLELCGGTHVKNSNDIVCFKITNIQSIARGIKRIEAVAGAAALEFYEKKFKNLNDISIMLCNKKDPVQATKKMIDDNICKEGLLGCYRQQVMEDNVENLLKKVEVINGKNFISEKLILIEMDLTKVILNKLLKKISAVVVLETEKVDDENLIHIGSSCEDIKANELVKKVSEKFEGIKGGGNENTAILKSCDSTADIVSFIKSVV